MSVLSSIGRLIQRLIRGSVHRLWVQPIESLLIPRLSVERPNRLQSVLLGISLWCAAAGRVLLEELRLNVIRWKSPDWSAAYIGTGFSAEALEHILFPLTPEAWESSQVYLWQVPGLVRKLSNEGDLVVCELNRVIHLSTKGVDFSFTTPQWVKQVLEGIDRPVDEVMSMIHSTVRRRVRKLDIQGYHFIATHSEDDFDLFYHRMYVPNIETRHIGHSPIVEAYDYVHSFFEKGTLLLVKQGDEMIGGSICQIKGDTCIWMFMGVMDGRMELIKNGANVALCWLAIRWGRGQGARCIDFCACRPIITDGVFNFKRQWGTKVTRYREIYTQWKFFGNNIPAKLRDHLNERGFISEISGEFYQVMLLDPGESVKETDLAHRLKTIAQYGLAGIVMISPGGEKSLISSMASSHYRIESSSQDVQSAPSQ